MYFGIGDFQDVAARVGCQTKKNSSERSKIFFEVLVNNYQKHEILSIKQFIDSIRLFR